MTLKSFIGGFGDVTAVFGDGRFAREMKRVRATDHVGVIVNSIVRQNKNGKNGDRR